MRLGQLARRLAIKTEEIVRFLASQNIAVDPGGNTRIEEPHVAMIVQKFAPDDEGLKEQIDLEADLPEAVPVRAEVEIENMEPLESLSSQQIPDIIKAPKIELPGLKVLGKIDLPGKKLQEPETKEEELSAEPRIQPQRFQRNDPPPKVWKNPITLAREREERDKQRHLKEERQKEKQRRTEFYLKRLKPQPPTKAARLVEEVFEMPAFEPEAPKTWWGRFMRWLNT